MDAYLGTAIISNTQLYEVDRLLDNSQERDERLFGNRNPNSLRVFDLLTLIEAIILNEKLYTLPAINNSKGGDLIERLTSEGIIETLKTDNFKVDIGELILSRMKEVNEYKIIAGSEDEIGKPIRQPERLFDAIKTFYNDIKEKTDSLYDGYRYNDLLVFDNIHSKLDGGFPDILTAHTYKDMAQRLIGWLEYSNSGAYQGCLTVLRDMYYIYTSEYLGVPYYPQSTRVDFAKDFPNYYDINFKTKLYAQIARALETTISEVYDDFHDKVAFIPPFSSVILSRSRKPANIIENILELRNEFAKTRKGFNDLELGRLNSTTLRERLKITKRQRQLLEDAAKGFGKLSKLNITKTIRYIPEVINPITDPVDLTKYSANLLMQPLEFILEWWRKRPIIKMYSLKDKLFQISEYQNLINKLFPNALDRDYSNWRFR
jgi:hypothetical protein